MALYIFNEKEIADYKSKETKQWRIYEVIKKNKTTYFIKKKMKIFKYIIWYRYEWMTRYEYCNLYSAKAFITEQKEKQIKKKIKNSVILIHEE